MSSEPNEIFRSEAVAHHAAALGRRGSVLRLYPVWTGWAYGLLLLTFVAALVFSAIVHVNEYASGPAVVRVEGRTVLTAVQAGTIVAVAAQPGQRVSTGEVLAWLDDSREHAELDSVLSEIELQTRNLLLDLDNMGARQSLTNLQGSRKLLEREIENRRIRAPHDGVVSDVRARLGQHVAPGEVVLSLTGPESSFTLVALLPGNSRPQLRPGEPLRLELVGYRYSYLRLTIDSVGDEIVGPVEARRYLGSDVTDAMALSGPVVVVKAKLPNATFTNDEREYGFFDGMLGNAEARVRSERILFSVAPALKSLWGRWND